MSEESACPDKLTECEFPLKAECSFKGCEPLAKHHDSYDVQYPDAFGRTLRGDITSIECGTGPYQHFLVPVDGTKLLANSLEEFENYLLNAVLQQEDIQVEFYQYLDILCTDNRSWSFFEPNIR